MLKFLGILMNLLIVDFYYFPFSFSFFPAFNLKMGLAAVGLAIAVFELVRKPDHSFPREVLVLMLCASFVSIACLLSVALNSTSHTDYVSYVVSAAVWLGGAFSVCWFMRQVHGDVSVKLLVYYLLAVCSIQCLFAVWIDHNPAMSAWVQSHTEGVHTGMDGARKFSVGVAVDVAGTRFATALAAAGGVLYIDRKELAGWEAILVWAAFFIITVFGNMIARTTVVGTGMGLLLIGYGFLKDKAGLGKIFLPLLLILLTGVPILVYLYKFDTWSHGVLRFAFEGFFSLVEKGHWQTTSNDILEGMVKFPDNIKTWIIGDGYFTNAKKFDVNYFGADYSGGYYMGTDIGYCRFIFYFGMAGLLALVSVIVYSTVICCRYSSKYTLLFLGILACGLGFWCKVATDVFYMCALLVCTSLMNPETAGETVQT